MSLVRKKHATERHRRVARAYIRDGVPLDKAMEQEGFSASYGRHGWQAVAQESQPFCEAFVDELKAAVKVAKAAELPAEDLRLLAECRLTMNLVRGRDEAAQSAKLIGQLKRVDMLVRHADGGSGLFLGLISDPASEAITKEVLEALNKKPSAEK
jgi:hypothetical protein